MARTKASVGAKVSSAKSTKARAAAPPPPPSPRTGGGGSSSHRSTLAGCNPVCPRETPAWQRPITSFFNRRDTNASDESAGPSKPRRRNVIDSDDESEPMVVTAAATVESAMDTSVDMAPRGEAGLGASGDLPPLEQSFQEDLPPLDGDSSHKIAEYFPKKPSKKEDKENVDGRRNSAKRSLDDAEMSVNKRARV